MANLWTKDQLDAINSTDKSTIVSAAAGSGKTAVLVERTIRMLCDKKMGIEADRLLAVTFTNDAANNMKDKLSAAMKKFLEQNPHDSWVIKQKELLGLATICTIDAFCMELVKNNINELEISGNFSVIDTQENNLMTEKAFAEASKYYFENYPDKMQILMDNFGEETDADIIKLGKELLTFKGSLPFPESWKKNSENKFEKIFLQFTKAQFAINVEPYLNVLKASCSSLEKAQKKLGNTAYFQIIHCLNTLVEKIEKLAIVGENFYKLKEFDEYKSLKYPAKPRKRTQEQDDIYEEIKLIKSCVSKAIKNLESVRTVPLAKFDSDNLQSMEIFGCLWDFVKKAEEILWENKLEKNKFFFSDITRLTISLLAKETENGFEKTDLARRITEEKRYKMILIDEFQDVNNLQSVIFKCVSDTENMALLGKNVFVVGDMKQSIYGFRQSNPHIFDNARELAKDEKNAEVCKAIYLKRNFRSRQNVLDFANFVFENVMSKELGEVDYDEEERLELGTEFPQPDFNTDIILYDKNMPDSPDDSEENDEDSEQTDNKQSVCVEAMIVANKVKKMIQQKVPVFDDGITRPCRAGDFCVLLRTGKLVNDYIKAFAKADIHAVGDSVKGYLGAREISLALSMLKIIDNPMNDIPFVAVCLSPIFGFTTDEISQIRQLDKTKKFYSLFLGIARDEKAEEFGFKRIETDNQPITGKCKNAIEIISKLRFYASGMSLEKLVRKLYDVTDLMSVASTFENSQQKRANLRMLVKYADNYEKSTGGGLSDFLRYLDNVSKAGNDFDEALTVSADENTVSVKTIHKSKGLEYPFVIVGDLDRQYNLPKRESKVVYNEKAGYGITLRNANSKANFRTVMYDYCFESNVSEQKSEELRILYVALTRAKEKLILPLGLRPKGLSRVKKAVDKIVGADRLYTEVVEGLMSYAEIIFVALLVQPNKKVLEEYLDVEISHLIKQRTKPAIHFEVGKNYYSADNENSEKFVPKNPDNALVSKIVQSITFDEKDDDAQTVAKLSVTEFVREVEEGNALKEITYFPPVPDIQKEKHTVTAAEKGTFTHLFMELCDFENAKRDFAAEVERLRKSNMLTEQQAENVDQNAVSSFFESDIYRLCKQSEKIHREIDFKVKLSDMALDNTPLAVYNNKDVMVQGIADLIIEEKDGLTVVDYKTDNVKEAGELVDRHFVQLLLYKKAFELIFGKKVKDCFIYSFKLRRSVKIDFESLQNVNINP